MYLPITIGGYITYGSQVQGNVLQSLPPGSLRVTSEILILLHIMCAFVINLNPFSQDMEELFGIPHSKYMYTDSACWHNCYSQNLSSPLWGWPVFCEEYFQ